MQRQLSTIISVILGCVMLVFLLLVLSSTAQTEAAAPFTQSLNSQNSPTLLPLKVAIDSDPNLDYQAETDRGSRIVIAQLMEGLFHYQPDGSVEPAGAITYTISNDLLVYTVTLRSNAVWADGQEVTAQHYVDGIIRLLEPATSNPLAYIMYVIEGAEDFNTGSTTDSNQVGVTAVDTYTLKFSLTGPTGRFPSIMAMPTTYPARLDLINSDPDWTEAGHFVGNGAYQLTQWNHDTQLSIEWNPLYHSATNVSIGKVSFFIISDAGDQLTAYENGELHVSGYPNNELNRILTDPVLRAELRRTPHTGIYYLSMNTQLTPTNNVSVCKALASAIDRTYIVSDTLGLPYREVATSVIPQWILGYQNRAVGYIFNVPQAQDYLSQAGYPGGVGFPGVELLANYGNETTIDAVANQWRSNLGITVTTVYTDWGAYQNLLNSCHDTPWACDYNAYRQGWVMDYGDPYHILSDFFHPDSPINPTGWDNAQYRQLISLTQVETLQLSRRAHMQEADRILVEEDVAVIPLYFYDYASLVKADVTPEYVAFGGPHFMNWEFVEQRIYLPLVFRNY